jgi:hypothetical protein
MTGKDSTLAKTSYPMAALQRLADTELSLRSRLGYVALLLAALMMTGIIGALWLTEPALPPRTQLAFAVMIAIGSSWVAFALWVLTHRRVLLAPHRIVAGRMAVTFTALFVLGSLAVGYQTGGPAAYAAAAMGLVMLAGAATMLILAHRRFHRLTERRTALEREVGRGKTE